MSAENLFTTSRIENVNQIIAELYDDSILLEKRMESFFLNLNNIVFFEKENFLFYQKQGQNYKTHSIYTINWNDEQKRRYQEEYCHMDDVLSILDSDSNVTFLTNQLLDVYKRQGLRRSRKNPAGSLQPDRQRDQIQPRGFDHLHPDLHPV